MKAWLAAAFFPVLPLLACPAPAKKPDEAVSGGMSAPTLYQRIKKMVDATPLFDTHEHLLAEAHRVARPHDIRVLSTLYTSTDLASSGFPTDKDREFAGCKPEDLARLWREIDPYWQFTKYTGYGRSILLAIRDLYDTEDISIDNVLDLSAKIRTAATPGFYDRVLRKRAGVKWFMVDPFMDMPEPIPGELRTKCLDDLIGLSSWRNVVSRLDEDKRQKPKFEDYLAVLDAELDPLPGERVVAFKTRIAYSRTIEFGPPDEASVLRRSQNNVCQRV